jgi:hypothetical protein
MSHATISIDTCSFHRVRCCLAISTFRQKAPPSPGKLCPKNSFPCCWTLVHAGSAETNDPNLTVAAQAEALCHYGLFKPLKMTPTTFTVSMHTCPL